MLNIDYLLPSVNDNMSHVTHNKKLLCDIGEYRDTFEDTLLSWGAL